MGNNEGTMKKDWRLWERGDSGKMKFSDRDIVASLPKVVMLLTGKHITFKFNNCNLSLINCNYNVTAGQYSRTNFLLPFVAVIPIH